MENSEEKINVSDKNETEYECNTIEELFKTGKDCPEWALTHTWNIYNNIQGVIKAIDQKVYVSGTLSLVVSTIVVFTVQESKIEGILVKLLLLAFTLSTINFIRLALSTLHARSKSSEDPISFVENIKNIIFNTLSSLPIQKRQTKPQVADCAGTVPHSLIFFFDISAQESSRYIQSFLKTTSKGSLKDLFGQIHEISGITKEKCYYYNLSSYALGIQLFFFFLSILIIILQV